MKPNEQHMPTRLSTAIFVAKAALLQMHRGWLNAVQAIPRHKLHPEEEFPVMLAESATRLWTDPTPSEAWYQRGKIQNLRVAAARLHGCTVPAGEVFSFWQQVGRASERRGYTRGRMLQEGCMIPAVGGGLCQLSNAIYQLALDAGCEILERHPHSRVVPGSATAEGRDATVAWNYIDLRFRPQQTMQMRATLTASELRVSLHAAEAAPRMQHDAAQAVAPLILGDHACDSCGNTVCFRHNPGAVHLHAVARTAYLLDAAWPEFAEYVASHHAKQDTIALPMDGGRWGKPQYAWPVENFATVKTATLTTMLRGMRSRRLTAQGAERQQALLEGARALAKVLSRSLTAEADEVCVSQSLLPFLWMSGALGGRRIRALMSQVPARALQQQLDRAYTLHPESTTLKDYRAPEWLLDAEEEALAHAEQIITPHAHIAGMFGARSSLLEWAKPAASARLQHPASGKKPTVLFPAATLGRKGAYELREALQGLDVELLLGGKVLEGENFWQGFAARPAARDANANLVVAPAMVESQPRALLQALVDGVPVITTQESGLHAGCGAVFVPAMDAAALRAAIRRCLAL